MWQDSHVCAAEIFARWVTVAWQLAHVDFTSPEWASWQVMQLTFPFSKQALWESDTG